MANTLCKYFIEEMEAEAASTRKCLERIPQELFGWKPHDKSMSMLNTALIVAEIPRWITTAIEKSEIDFATYEHIRAKSTADLVNYFNRNLEGAIKSLEGISDDNLSEMFHLKNNGQMLISSTKKVTIGSSLNHLVHHRGQLTVYMRMNDIPVPSIYGPSADESGF
jgi:uncharacterized damage-inducible protein DinB